MRRSRYLLWGAKVWACVVLAAVVALPSLAQVDQIPPSDHAADGTVYVVLRQSPDLQLANTDGVHITTIIGTKNGLTTFSAPGVGPGTIAQAHTQSTTTGPLSVLPLPENSVPNVNWSADAWDAKPRSPTKISERIMVFIMGPNSV